MEVLRGGTSFKLGSADVQVLGPVKEDEKLNNMSIVLRIGYGDTSFLFTGDMELEEENSLLAAGLIEPATVLKVGHHGSSSSSGKAFIEQAAPSYAVISVGRDNAFGHPSGQVLDTLSAPVPADPAGGSYVLNVNTHKFHYPYCDSVDQMSEKNKAYTDESREEIIARGFRPCGKCHP